MSTLDNILGGTKPKESTAKKPQPTTVEASDPTQVAEKRAEPSSTEPPAPEGYQGKWTFNDPSVLNVNGKQPSVIEQPRQGTPNTFVSSRIGGAPKRMSYVEMNEALNPYHEPTDEQLEKERKKEKRQKIFAAIGDGISALSNLYFTSKGAPNMYDGNNTQSEAVSNYWQKIRKDREENRRRYLDGYIKARQMDDAYAINKQNADANEEYKRSEAKRKQDLAAAQNEVLKARADKDEAATALAQKKLEYMIAGWPIDLATKQAKLDLTNAQIGVAHSTQEKNVAQAGKANRTGGSGGSGGSGKGGSGGSSGYPWYDKNGGLHYAKTEGIAKQMSKQNGTYKDDFTTNSSNKLGIKSTTTTHSGWHSQKPASKPAQKKAPVRSSTGKKPTGVQW